MPCLRAGPTQAAAWAAEVLMIAWLALACGLSVNEISIPRLLRIGFAFFFRGSRNVFLTLLVLPLTWTFRVTNLNVYWRRSALARAPKPAEPASAQESCVCTVSGPSLREPRREFFLLRSWATWP